VAHGPAFFALPIPILLGRAFIVLLLAFGEADVEFGAAAGPVHFQRHDGVTGAFDFADQDIELASLQQQFARADGVWPDVRRGFFHRDEMGAEQEGFAVFDDDVGFADLGAAIAQAFNFPAFERHAGFVGVFDEIVEASPAVLRDLAGGVVFFVFGLLLIHPTIIRSKPGRLLFGDFGERQPGRPAAKARQLPCRLPWRGTSADTCRGDQTAY
jgi:hypothetical protein